MYHLSSSLLLLGRSFHLVEQQTYVNMNALRRRIRSIFHAIRHKFNIPQSDIDERSPPVLPHNERISSHEVEPCAEQVHNIYHIAFLLRQRLIRDVVSAILEYADLYSSTTSTTKFHPTLVVSEREAPEQLIECKIAKVKTRVLRPVRKIAFEIHSNDRRFAEFSIEGARTWFTARKSSPEITLLSDSMLDLDARNELEYSHHKEICTNALYSQRCIMTDWWKPHQITWRADSTGPVEAEWVSSFVAGDRFAVFAWANHHSEWENYVADISVTVHYVAVI
jgi:hypothetical protein